MRTVILIRHGATILNSDDHTKDRLRGWMDLPLSEVGQAEAHKLGTELPKIDILLSSDLLRAVQTARILADYSNCKLDGPSKDFRPWNIGEFAGKPAREAAPVLASFADQLPAKTVPGGESFTAFRSRFLNGLLKAFCDYDDVIGIVTHHRCIRLISAWANRGFPVDGSIDQDHFARKGDRTAHWCSVGIPPDRLLHAARFPDVIEEPTPAFGDGREERYWDWREKSAKGL